MTGVFENLNTDMHSNQITSSSYHSLHKSQESPTLPVSTATDSSYYNSQQPGHCAGSPFGQLGSYQYHGSATSTVPYNAKSYDIGFNSSYGAYSSYGSNSSPTPADTGKEAFKLFLIHLNEFHAFLWGQTLKRAHDMIFMGDKLNHAKHNWHINMWSEIIRHYLSCMDAHTTLIVDIQLYLNIILNQTLTLSDFLLYILLLIIL